jgi:hypothetical protein
MPILADEIAPSWPADQLPPSICRKPAAELLDKILATSAQHDFAAMQLEYARQIIVVRACQHETATPAEVHCDHFEAHDTTTR